MGSSLWKALPVWTASYPEAAHPDFTQNVHLGYPTSSSLSVQETSLQEEARQGSSEPHRRSFLLAFGDLKEQGRDAAGPPLCLLSRRAKANGKEWKWQRCVRALISIIRTLGVRASRLSRRLITVTRTILVAITLNQVNRYPLQSRGMTLPSSAEVEVGTELSFSSDMNKTVLERLAHLEGKLKEMEEENKSLSLRIALILSH